MNTEKAETPYDSTEDTKAHIALVRSFLYCFADQLHVRGERHDASKLMEPEKSVFDEFTPKLKGCTYGSDEYREFLAGMKVGLDHHYQVNDHHPEYFKDGIHGMTLFDLVEMFCDWMAAVKRHDDGDIYKSIDINAKRFGYGDLLKALLGNTARRFETLEEQAKNKV